MKLTLFDSMISCFSFPFFYISIFIIILLIFISFYSFVIIMFSNYIKFVESTLLFFSIFIFIVLILLFDNYFIFIENIVKDFLYIFPLFFFILSCFRLGYNLKYKMLTKFITLKFILFLAFVLTDFVYFNNSINIFIKINILDKIGFVMMCEDLSKTEIVLFTGFFGVMVTGFVYRYQSNLNHQKDLYIAKVNLENSRLKSLSQDNLVGNQNLESLNLKLEDNLKFKDQLLIQNELEYHKNLDFNNQKFVKLEEKNVKLEEMNVKQEVFIKIKDTFLNNQYEELETQKVKIQKLEMDKRYSVENGVFLDVNKANKISNLTYENNTFHLKGPGVIDRTTRFAMQNHSRDLYENRKILLKEFFIKRDHKILYRYYTQSIQPLMPTFENIPNFFITGYLMSLEELDFFRIFIKNFKNIEDNCIEKNESISEKKIEENSSSK